MKNNKSLGQNWLKNRLILDDIADMASGEQSFFEGVRLGLAPRSAPEKKALRTTPAICLEIGPGLGTLTSSLLKRFDKVIAVEFDKNLANNLPKSFPGKNLEVINQDILKFDFSQISEPYAVAGNIPYYITSPIIEKLLTTDNKPIKIVLLIQKEVAERIADDRETVLSLFVKNYVKIELGPVVKREEFTPPPKVDSQVIILTPYAQPQIDSQIFKLIKLGFLNPRKKLLANLATLKSRDDLKQIFAQLDISENARPADLHLDKWSELSHALKS